MKRLLCIALILLLLPCMALGEGVALSFTAQDSKLWPQGAAEALNTLLDGMTLTVDDTGADMRCQLARGDQAWLSLSSGAPRITLERMLSLSQSLGTLLADFEREEHRSIEMGDVLTSPLQLTYALTREEWQEKWPDVLALIADVFPAYDLSGFDITSDKATFKRYFARDGQEIGAYFYAGSAQVAPEDIREIRLEWIRRCTWPFEAPARERAKRAISGSPSAHALPSRPSGHARCAASRAITSAFLPPTAAIPAAFWMASPPRPISASRANARSNTR